MRFIHHAFFAFVVLYSSSWAELALSVAAESAILINADTGAILYKKNPHLKLFPASITKIATCAYILHLRQDKLDEVLTADQDCVGSVTEEAKARSKYKLPSHWLVTDCSHIGIKKGEKMRMDDLLYGMMVSSADDASNVLAQGVSGSVPEFMKELNSYLQGLGCKDTNFNNPHGLHHPEHLTTAYDMAQLTKEALKHPKFREIVSTVRYTRPKTNMQESTVLLQTNKLLRKGEFHYAKAIGVKTGWHSKAGNTFVAAAKDGDRTLIAVLMNVKERRDIFKETIKLFDAAFNQPKMRKILVRAGPQKYSFMPKGSNTSVPTYLEKDFALTFYPAEEPKVRAFIEWSVLEPPILKGQAVGRLLFKNSEGISFGEANLLAAENYEGGIFAGVKDVLSQHRSIFLTVGILLISLGGFVFLYRRMR